MRPTGRVTRLHPAPTEELQAEDVYADLTPGSAVRGDEPYVAINMVSTLNGRVSVGGKASPIGSSLDRRIMRNIRSAFDAVLVGAGTVRAEEMNLSVPDELSEKRKANGLPAQPLGLILAGSDKLPLQRKLFRQRGGQTVVVVAGDDTPQSTIEEAEALGIRVLDTKAPGRPEPVEILRLLKDLLNVRTLLLEGGPTVNGSFLASGKVDELFLTLSPKISLSTGDESTIAQAQGARSTHPIGFDLASVHSASQEGELYLRYRRTIGR